VKKRDSAKKRAKAVIRRVITVKRAIAAIVSGCLTVLVAVQRQQQGPRRFTGGPLTKKIGSKMTGSKHDAIVRA
jgi:hypothetical protein